MGQRKCCWVIAVVFLAGLPGALAQEGAIRRVHDPVMIREKDTYYVYSSGHGVPARRSKDLVHWEQIARVFKDDLPAWGKAEVPGARDVWAPDISYFKDEFHLYYSISTMGSQRSCIGFATTKTLDPASPQYGWVDHGKVIESFPGKMDYNTIDPNLVLDEKGDPWLVFGSFWGGIKLVKLDPTTGKLIKPDTRIHALAAQPNNGPIEGAFMVRKNGFYYLFASIDHCCRGVASNYKVIVGRSREITGPYVDFAGKPMLEGNTTLVLAGYGYCRGPGHNGILLDKDGDWMVHHMYDVREKGAPTMQIRPLLWASDGWPMVAEPVSGNAFATSRPTTEGLYGIWRQSLNFGADEYLELWRGGKVNGPVPGPTWSLDGNLLRIRWPNDAAPGGAWIDTCIVAPDAKSYVGRNQRGDLIRGLR